MATVRERGYTHWDGHLLERRHPWWPITRTGIELAFRKKKFKFVFSMAFLPAVVFLAGIYISERMEDFRFLQRDSDGSAILNVNPAFFRTYMASEFMIFMLIMLLVFAAGGLIADDLKHNSLQLYFSRPLRKRDYFLGKAAVVAFFVLILTLVPALLLLIMKLVFSGSFRFLGQYPLLPLSIAGYAVVLTVFLAFYALLLSALSKNSRYVSVLIFMVYLFSDIAFGIFQGIFRSPYVALISLKSNLLQVAAVMFGQRPPFAFPPVLSFAVLAAVCLVSAAVLRRRIRGVEVVR